MSEESHYEAVNKFREIKRETECDDLTAAILTLAQPVSWIDINVQVSDDGYPERLGKDIADAIENVTKDGSISVMLDGEMMNNVRAMVDVSGEVDRPSKRSTKPKAKAR
jgi:hypothetical protein